MELPILRDFLIIFSLSIAVILVFHRLKVPAIVGFLLTGIIAGPHGMKLVRATHEVELMAEVGVILLLFTIGLELSLGELTRLKKPVFLGGSAQLLLTILVFDLLMTSFGLPPSQALFIGFLAALSSTAIVLKLLNDRAELEAPHGRISLSILIFQDLAIVPMMLVVPFLARTDASLSAAILPLVLKGTGAVLVVFLLARYVVPRLLHLVMRTRSRELFLLTTLALCLSVAFLTSAAGLSLSLGAFLAGLIMSESEFSLSALEGVIPFRDVFTSLFFISIGMLLDASFLLEQPTKVFLITACVLSIKATIATSAGLFIGYPLRTALITGIGLSQVGEFSFILAKEGLSHGLLDGTNYQLFLSSSILTMALTPFALMAAPGMADAFCRIPGLRRLASFRREIDNQKDHSLSDHLVIVGFGPGGRILAQTARAAEIDYVVVEMNPDTVRTARKEGEIIFHGDAGQAEILSHAGIHRARVLAVLIPDPAAVRRIVETAHRLNPSLHIVARTRFVPEIGTLQALGADDVVPEEFETSIEIFTRVLAKYLVPRSVVERVTADIRAECYGMLRSPQCPRNGSLGELSTHLANVEISALEVGDKSLVSGKTLAELELRKQHDVTIVAIRRDKQTVPNPDGSFRLQARDIVYLFGAHATIIAKRHLFSTP